MLLALDLARRTGWAAGNPCGSPAYGNFTLSDGLGDARRFLQLTQKITALIEAHMVTHLVTEAPFVGKDRRENTLLALFGYRAAAYIAGANKRVHVLPMVTPATVRKHFMGHGGLTRSKAKEAVLDKCRWRGWTPKNDDEADALALWDYRCAVDDPNHLVMGMRKGAWRE